MGMPKTLLQQVGSQDVRGWTAGHDARGGHEHHAVGVGRRQVEVVQHGQHATAGVGLAAQQTHGQVLVGRVQARGRLVEEQEALAGAAQRPASPLGLVPGASVTWAMARASATRCRSPVESVAKTRPARCAQSTASSSARTTARSASVGSPPCSGSRPSRATSSTVKAKATLRSALMTARRRARSSARPVGQRSAGQGHAAPAPVVGRRPGSAMSVDLPAPFGPATATISPGATSTDTSARRVAAPTRTLDALAA